MNDTDPQKMQLVGGAAESPDATRPAPAPARAAQPDPDATVFSAQARPSSPAPSSVPDPDATVLAAGQAPMPAPTQAPAGSRTALLGSLPTTELDPAQAPVTVSAAAPTTVLPGDAPAEPLTDGIDALDDPYRSPASLDDLTVAQAPVQLASPVKSTRRRRMPVWAVLLIVVVLLGAAGGAAWYTYKEELWGGKTVPMVVGLSQDAATQQLEAKGFKVEVAQQPADDGIGTVVSCTPEPGRRAQTTGAATITVAVARTIPQVVGLQSDAAQKALYDAGAANVRIQSVNSDAEPDTVVAVSPEEGVSFASTDEIVIQVATPYVVPSVVGQTLEAAKTAVQKAGLTAKVTFIKSSEARNTVVSTSPEAGEKLEEGGEVELKVSSPYPTSVPSLGAYFDCTSKEVSTYLGDEKYSLVFGARLPNGDAHAIYTGPQGDALYFTSSPEIVDNPGGSAEDVLAAGAPIGGVRYEFSAATLPSGAAQTDAGVKAVMEACGFTGLKETATQDDLAKLGYEAQGRSFMCAYGEADSYSWAVIVDGSQQGGVSVTALAFVPTRFKGGVDLSKFDNSPAKYIACADLYDASAVKASQFEEPATDAGQQ